MQKLDVVMVGYDWFHVTQRQNHVAAHLSEYFRVIYFSGYYSFLRNLGGVKPKKNLKISENLHVIELPSVLPFSGYFRGVNRVNSDILSRFIVSELAKLDSRKRILFITAPREADLIGKTGEEAAVFDYIDNYLCLPSSHSKKILAQMLNECLAKSKAVFASSGALYEGAKRVNQNSYLVNNAVEKSFIEMCAKEARRSYALHDGIKKVVGYIGSVSSWIDLELVKEAARENPGALFLMIGPIKTDISDYLTVSNLKFMGTKDYSELPGYLKSFDVAIIPFKINELTRSVDPVKAYEYLAAGKTVLAVKTDEMSKFSGVMKLADNETQFKSILKELMRGNGLISPEKCGAFAARNTWEERASVMAGIISKVAGI